MFSCVVYSDLQSSVNWVSPVSHQPAVLEGQTAQASGKGLTFAPSFTLGVGVGGCCVEACGYLLPRRIMCWGVFCTHGFGACLVFIYLFWFCGS